MRNVVAFLLRFCCTMHWKALAMCAGLSLLAPACIHHTYCEGRKQRRLVKKENEVNRLQPDRGGESASGLMLWTDGMAAPDLLGARSTMGFVSRGRNYLVSFGLGAASNFSEDSWGMALHSAFRVRWPFTDVLYPRGEASFTNFAFHWGDTDWRPRWVIHGDVGFDFPVFRWGSGELVLAPSLSLGVSQWDEAHIVGATKEIRSDEDFYWGGKVGLGLYLW